MAKLPIPIDLKNLSIVFSIIATIFLFGVAWANINSKINNIQEQVCDQGSQIQKLQQIQIDVSYIRGQLDQITARKK